MATLNICDLSVGDWVCVQFPDKDEWFGKVVSLSNSGGVQVQCANKIVRCTTTFIKSVPITAEILKNNGWYEDDYDYDTCTDYITDNTLIMYNKERKDWKACIMNNSPVVRVKVFFSYVHELQHALRLAGLDEEINL